MLLCNSGGEKHPGSDAEGIRMKSTYEICASFQKARHRVRMSRWSPGDVSLSSPFLCQGFPSSRKCSLSSYVIDISTLASTEQMRTKQCLDIMLKWEFLCCAKSCVFVFF